MKGRLVSLSLSSGCWDFACNFRREAFWHKAFEKQANMPRNPPVPRTASNRDFAVSHHRGRLSPLIESRLETSSSPHSDSQPSPQAQTHRQHVKSPEFELPLPVSPQPQPRFYPQTFLSPPHRPPISKPKPPPSPHTPASNPQPDTGPDALTPTDIAILNNLQEYLNIPDLVVAAPHSRSVDMREMARRDVPTSYYMLGMGGEEVGCGVRDVEKKKEVVEGEGEGEGEEEEEGNGRRGRWCTCGCAGKWTLKRAMVALRVLSCLFAIGILVCISLVPVDGRRTMDRAGICVVSNTPIPQKKRLLTFTNFLWLRQTGLDLPPPQHLSPRYAVLETSR